ncbi:unnamed protein product [Sphagnum balticum]
MVPLRPFSLTEKASRPAEVANPTGISPIGELFAREKLCRLLSEIDNFQLVTKKEIFGNLSGRIIESPGQNIRFGRPSELCRNKSRPLVSVRGDKRQIDRISDACRDGT